MASASSGRLASSTERSILPLVEDVLELLDLPPEESDVEDEHEDEDDVSPPPFSGAERWMDVAEARYQILVAATEQIRSNSSSTSDDQCMEDWIKATKDGRVRNAFSKAFDMDEEIKVRAGKESAMLKKLQSLKAVATLLIPAWEN